MDSITTRIWSIVADSQGFAGQQICEDSQGFLWLQKSLKVKNVCLFYTSYLTHLQTSKAPCEGSNFNEQVGLSCRMFIKTISYVFPSKMQLAFKLSITAHYERHIFCRRLVTLNRMKEAWGWADTAVACLGGLFGQPELLKFTCLVS